MALKFIRRSRNSSVHKILFLMILLSFVFLHIRSAFMDQIAFLGGTAREHFLHQQRDPDSLTSLAKRAYIRDDDPEKALSLYRRALGSLSVHIPAWIGIAEIEAESGESGAAEKSVSISNHIDAISPDNGQWRWARTMLAYTLEQNTILADNLSWFIENNFGKREQAITLAESVWPDSDELLYRIGIKNSPHLLHFYIKQKEVAKAMLTWEAILKNNLAKEANTLRLVDFFISNNEIEEANSSAGFGGIGPLEIKLSPSCSVGRMISSSLAVPVRKLESPRVLSLSPYILCSVGFLKSVSIIRVREAEGSRDKLKLLAMVLLPALGSTLVINIVFGGVSAEESSMETIAVRIDSDSGALGSV